jgi:Tol biopolymer transport system component
LFTLLITFGSMAAGQALTSGVLTFNTVSRDESDIFLLDVRTGILYNLTKTLPGYSWQFSWSDDGTQLVFVQSHERRSVLMTMAANGNHVQELPGTPRSATYPRWSPDGAWLLFTSSTNNNVPDMFVLPAQGGRPRAITQNTDSQENDAAWSPDGNWIAYQKRQGNTRNIHLQHVQNDTDRQLTANDVPDEYPAWSPDGTLLAYRTLINGAGTIMLFSLDDNTEMPLDAGRRQALSAPTWSPDGTQIAFSAQVFGEELFGIEQSERVGTIWIGNIAENNGRSVGAGLQLSSPIVWSADGHFLAFSAAEAAGDTDLYMLDTRSGQWQKIIALPGIESFPVWQP